MAKGKFIKSIALMQVIGIILVVLGHSFHEYPDGAFGYNWIVTRLIYSFHMPLFLFVSGLLLVMTMDRYSTGQFVFGKAKKLLLPFAVLTLVTFVPRGLAGGAADDPYPLTWSNFAAAFVLHDHNPIPFFWFIWADFVLLTVTYIFITAGRRRGISPLAMLSVLFVGSIRLFTSGADLTTALSLDYIAEYGCYFILGAIYGIRYKLIDNALPWAAPWFCVLMCACWLVCFRLFEDSWLRLTAAVFGIMMVISLTKIMERRNITCLDHLIGANYMIFLFSWYFNIAAQQLLAHFVTLPWWVHSALSLVFGIYIPWLGYRFLERHQEHRIGRWSAFLLGQSFRRRITPRAR